MRPSRVWSPDFRVSPSSERPAGPILCRYWSGPARSSRQGNSCPVMLGAAPGLSRSVPSTKTTLPDCRSIASQHPQTSPTQSSRRCQRRPDFWAQRWVQLEPGRYSHLEQTARHTPTRRLPAPAPRPCPPVRCASVAESPTSIDGRRPWTNLADFIFKFQALCRGVIRNSVTQCAKGKLMS